MGIANDLASLDATAQAELIRKGDVSAEELVNSAIEAAQRVNPHINARSWVSRRPPVSA
jgi:amidase